MIELAFAVSLLLQEPADERIIQLIDALAADYEEERVAARKELERAGAKAEPHLVAALKKDDHRIRKVCLELLLIIKSTKAVEQAGAIFRDANEEKTVRQAAFDYARTCGKLAEDILIEALDSAEAKWRRDALQTLTEIKSEKCAEKVAALYDRETDKAMKDAAFSCLQNIGKPAQPYLLKLLGSTDPDVRRGALVGLRNIGATSEELFAPVSKLFLAETAQPTLTEAYEFLRLAGGKSEPTFLDGLKSGQEPVRLCSIAGLRLLKSEAALEPLAALFENDGSEKVREEACVALEEFKLKSEDAFVRALDNANAKVRLRALKALGNIKSEKPYEKIAQLFRTDKDPEVHREAFDYCRKIGIRAEKDLLLALKDESPDIRREAITALGLARSEAAIDPLIELTADLNPEVRTLAMDALVRLGPKAIQAVEAAVAAGRLKKKTVEAILALFYQEEVEKILDKLVTDEGGTGFFEGQFAGLEKFGKEKALPVLVKLATDYQYAYRLLEWKGDEYRHKQSLKELAIMALGVIGDKSTAETLRNAIKHRTYAFGDEEYEEYVIALHRLGEKGFYDALVLRLATESKANLAGEDKAMGYSQLFSLAMVQNRVGDRARAQEAYEQLVRTIEEHKKTKECELYAAALYNLACLYTLQGEKNRALEHLSRAVDAGFKDKGWIQLDRDLEGIRGEEGYKKLVADPKRFEKPLPQ